MKCFSVLGAATQLNKNVLKTLVVNRFSKLICISMELGREMSEYCAFYSLLIETIMQNPNTGFDEMGTVNFVKSEF